MALPEKKINESKPDFIARFMADKTALADFPNDPQRLEICEAQWRKEC
jgi:hypothetical protein